MLSILTDRDRFIRSADLAGSDHVYEVMINREGDMLARVGGEFDADKANSLRETLRQPGR